MPARLLRFFVALALGVVGVGVSVAPPAAAADTFSISGTVTDAASDDGDGIDGLCLEAYRIGEEGPDYDPTAEGCSDATGAYTIPGLSPGRYLVGFGGSSEWSQRWYDAATTWDDADPLVVTTIDRTGIDFELVATGTVSGHVTDETTGDPIEGVEVEAQGVEDEDQTYAEAFTDAVGAYSLAGLPPGDYTISFASPDETLHLSEYYEDTYSQATADPVTVTSGGTSTADGELGPPGRITGEVTSGGVGVGDVTVRPYELVNGTWVGGLQPVDTASDGSYELFGLHPGTYRLMFDAEDAGYGSVYWEDSATLADADDIDLATGATETANAEVTVLGSISGTVTSGGEPLDDICVRAWRQDDEGDWDSVKDWCYAADYELTGLPAGQYKLEFDPSSSSLATEWYEDAPTRDAATVVAVEDGTAQTIDVDIPTGSTLLGEVTSEAGDAPLEGIEVRAYAPSGGNSWTDVASTRTDPLGDYSFALPGGTYRVQFSPGRGHLGEWFDNKPSLATATSVTLPSGGATAEADAALTQGGEVTGTVTNPQGNGFLASVRAYRRNSDGTYSDFTERGTDSDGYFSLSLPAGTYKLEYTGFRLATEWWDNETSEADADPITVVAGGTYSGKNAQLDAGATVSGHVTDANGDDLAGVRVAAYRLFGPGDAFSTFSDYTDASGEFLIAGLEEGTYTLEYDDNEHLTEYWQDKPALASADFFAVPRSGVVVGKDAQLADGGHLEGRVTADGNDYEEGDVELWRHGPDGWTDIAETESDGEGYYEFGGLATGQYAVRFEGRDGLASEWWDDKPTRAQADLVEVTAGATTEDIDAELEHGTSVSGTVTGPGGAAVRNVSVYAYRMSTGELESTGDDYTSSNGGYEIEGLAAGSYKLLFLDEESDNPLAPEWWNDRLTPGLADVVTVGTTPVSGKDAQLIAGARITGEVTDPSGPAVEAEVTAYRLVDGTYEEEADTEVRANGTYELRGLPAGTYKMRFDGGSTYDDVFYDGASSLATATAFAVGPSETVTGIGAAFAPLVPVTPGTPVINGTPRVGSVLTVGTGGWTPSDVVFTFEWRADNTPIPGATGTSLTLTNEQLNATITVAVTGTSGSQSSTAVSPGVGPVAPALTPVANNSAPTVTGSATVGSTLTASPGTWSPGGVSLGYQWLSDGTPIAGATGTTYAVPAGQVGRRLSVQVTATLAGSAPFTAASAATGPVAPGTLTSSGKPKLAGKAKVGKTLKVKLGDAAVPGAAVTIEWFANGKRIKGAKGKSLKLAPSHKGRTVTAVVTVVLPGYTPLVLKTKGVKVS